MLAALLLTGCALPTMTKADMTAVVVGGLLFMALIAGLFALWVIEQLFGPWTTLVALLWVVGSVLGGVHAAWEEGFGWWGQFCVTAGLIAFGAALFAVGALVR